jgi:hypothetical protein
MYSPNKQVGIVDPLTGQPVQQMTNVPPAQANTLGQAQPVFNPQAQQAAQGVYGGIDQRQNAVSASALFHKTQTTEAVEEKLDGAIKTPPKPQLKKVTNQRL